MAEELFEHPVPNWTITIPDRISPWSALWWNTGSITNIPAESVGWLFAQGWEIASVSYDTSTVPATPRYSMTKQVLHTSTVLQHLLDDFTLQHNNAKFANSVRYNSVVLHWGELLDVSENYMDVWSEAQAGHVQTYIADLSGYMDNIEAAIDTKETEYDQHVTTATDFLTGLGTTELARINEQFAASLAVQLQQLTDRGLYSAGVAADITQRNTRDRDEQIQALNDRLNREKFENQHKLYEQQFRMREQEIVQKMNISAARLAGKQLQHDGDMQLMKYMLDTRNQLLVGLYGFVERRDDISPSWENLAQMVAGLGDAGGGWISP